jgi:hypothetical protein
MLTTHINKAEVLSDFAKTLSALPGGLIEISKAPPGGSIFSKAIYFESISPSELDALTKVKENIGFLAGVDADELRKTKQELTFGKTTSRKARDEMVFQRNIISLEIDFKDSIPGFLDLPSDVKKTIVDSTFQRFFPKIKARFGDIWIACFSGNSLHLHLKLNAPMECTDPERYSRNYEFLVDRFESDIFEGEYKFDRNCKNSSRLMRVPYSVNWKKIESPIPTDVIYFNSKSDSSQAINAIWEAGDTLSEQVKQSQQAFSSAPESSDHKENLKRSLSFQKILQYFGYSKFNTLKEQKNGETVCSSPWKKDSSPSCYLNESKKQFNDFSSGRGGDIFTFLAEMASLNVKSQFREVLSKAEIITGIKRPPMSRPYVAVDNTVDKPKKRRASFEEDYVPFFDNHLPEASRDILSGRLMFKHEGEWISGLNRINILKSHALDTDHIRKTHVEDHLYRYAEKKPKKLLIDLPQWDGIDRIQQIAKAVKLKNISQQGFEELMKEWGAGIFKRLNNPKFQNHLIVLKGPQGAGKDHLVDALVGGLEQYFTDVAITDNERDNYTLLASHLVGRINEFDRTSKVAAATIKALVTGHKASFIPKYEVDPTPYTLRCSLIATCNVNEVLRDHTGNRRFRIFEIINIEKGNYPDQESPQILAQFKHLAEMNYEASADSVQAMNSYIEGQTPDDPSEMILEVWDSRIEELELKGIPAGGRLRTSHVQYVIDDISRMFRIGIKPLQTLLKSSGRSHKDKYKAYYCKGSKDSS